MRILAAFAAAALVACGADAVSANDYRIRNLPTWNLSEPVMYSGYITVDEQHGRALFFWLVESLNNPIQDPLVFWTNGGPGCSSLGGLLEEHGPFRPVDSQGSLQPFPWTWSRKASVLYVEQPAGVGFSYSNTTSDYTVGDARAAADIYTFMQRFYDIFPTFRRNPLWITGESYGGHYVPHISQAIVAGNLKKDQPYINFEGFMVGNAWTVAELDNTGAVLMWYWNNMIAKSTMDGIFNTCNMSDVGPLAAATAATHKALLLSAADAAAVDGDVEAPTRDGVRLARGSLGFRSKNPELTADASYSVPVHNGLNCNDYQNLATTQMNATDIYFVTGDVCIAGPSGPTLGQERGLMHAPRAAGKGLSYFRAFKNARTPFPPAPIDSDGNAGCMLDYDPCIDSKVATFLNRPDVQRAIHVNPSTIPGGSWTGCSNVVNYSYDDLLSSMLPVYEYLLTNKPDGRYLVFSGDHDGIVPFPGTRLWLERLQEQFNMSIKPGYDFRAYNTPEGQVAGWTWTLQTSDASAELTFASVRAAGHLVPYTQGSRGLQMFETFLDGPFAPQ